jgi:2-dehydro-3-deoxygluconokinase
MTRKKVVSFGELLLRLSAPGHERLLQSPVLNANFGGGEANVAVSLAHFGMDSHFVTRLPASALGDAALRVLRGEGVQIDSILRGGERMGIYFCETGAGQRPSRVFYDRAHSALSEVQPLPVRWPDILRGARWFHTSGITPALGPGPAESVRAALAAARDAGATVSVDLNFRRKLWDEDTARRALQPLMKYVHVLIANEEHLRTILGAPSSDDAARGHPDGDASRAVAEQVVADYGVQQVAITVRESISAGKNGWSGMVYDGRSRTLHRGPRYVVHMVDRIGAGDSFAAGLIFALLSDHKPEAALRFALAAGALKHTIPGDFNRVSVAEVERLASGEESGRVRR